MRNMKNKKKTSVFVTAGVVIVVLYVIFAVKPLNEEFQFIPVWKIDVSNPPVVKAEENEATFPFKLMQTMGYFTQDGKVTNFSTFPYKATISDSYYTSYRENNSSCDFYTPEGKKAGTIKEKGFPMFDQDRLFIFLPGGSSFARLSSDGKKMWEFESSSPITAFDSSEAGNAAGFADGSISQFDTEGKILQQFTPGGSEFNIISGAAISNNGNFIASVSGQNKERFVLAKREDAHSKIVFHEFTDNSLPYQKLVKFSKDDSKVYYDFDGKLGIVDTEKYKCRHIKIKGQAISLKESDLCVFVLTKQNDNYTVYILEKNSSLIGSFSYVAEASFIQTDENSLYIGKDSSISKISIVKK